MFFFVFSFWDIFWKPNRMKPVLFFWLFKNSKKEGKTVTISLRKPTGTSQKDIEGGRGGVEEAHVSVTIFVQAVSVFRHYVVQQLDFTRRYCAIGSYERLTHGEKVWHESYIHSEREIYQ